MSRRAMKIANAALALARERYPNAEEDRHVAFANCVVYLVVATHGDLSGQPEGVWLVVPEQEYIRGEYRARTYVAIEYYVRWHFRVSPPQMSYDEAVDLLLAPDGPVFGELPPHARPIGP